MTGAHRHPAGPVCAECRRPIFAKAVGESGIGWRHDAGEPYPWHAAVPHDPWANGEAGE